MRNFKMILAAGNNIAEAVNALTLTIEQQYMKENYSINQVFLYPEFTNPSQITNQVKYTAYALAVLTENDFDEVQRKQMMKTATDYLAIAKREFTDQELTPKVLTPEEIAEMQRACIHNWDIERITSADNTPVMGIYRAVCTTCGKVEVHHGEPKEK